ncbi:MAG: CARDB domain-containing protein [Bacteroidales bacterium]|nr:CARDB domain-containing protein [Bacteroidales bacterium]
MKNLFKKSFVGVLFLFILLGVFGQINIAKAAGSAGIISLNGCYAGIELEKATYTTGESIKAGAAGYNACTGGTYSIGASLDYGAATYSPVIQLPGGGAAFFTAPVCPGTVWYKMALNSSGIITYSDPVGLTFDILGTSCTVPPPPVGTGTPPTLKDLSATYIQETAVGEFKANIVSAGYTSAGVVATITKKGFCYFKTSESPSVVSGTDKSKGGCVEVSGLTVGEYQANPGAFGLSSDTEYWYYGYAKNSVNLEGSIWGKFKTLPIGGDPVTIATAKLTKSPTSVKNVVKKGSAGGEGSAYFEIEVSGLTSGGCTLQNNGVNVDGSASEVYESSAIIKKKTVSNLTAADNDFQLNCLGSSSPLLESAIQKVKAQSGTLTLQADCGIPVGASSCTNVPISWSTVSPYSTTNYQSYPPLITQVKKPAEITGTSISSPMNTGSTTLTVPFNVSGVTYGMWNSIDKDLNMGAGENLLDTKTIKPYCIASTWDAITKKCVALPPDLTITTAPTPTDAVVNTTFTSSISNIGTGSTGGSFNNIMRVSTTADGLSPTSLSPVGASSSLTLAAGGNTNTTSSYKFTTAGNYYVSFCADADPLWNKKISESNEDNNCGPWTNITVWMTDLFAGPVYPTEVAEDTAQTSSSIITNIGTVSTEKGFDNLFQICKEGATWG